MAAVVGIGFASLKKQLANTVNVKCERIFGLERARKRKTNRGRCEHV
jgi:hypothetical protein